MLNKIINFSLNNRLIVLVLSCLILLGGVLVLLRTEVDIFPDLNAPTVVVMTEAPGLAPDEVERLVTYPIETAVNGATGVRRVRSSSATGFSVVWVEFDWGTDVYRARQIVTEKTASLAEALPKGVKAPVLGPQSSILGEMMIIGLTVAESREPRAESSEPTTLAQLRTLADRTIRPRLLALGGVSQVAVIGGDEVEYQIQLDPGRMRSRGVTLTQVREAVEGLNDNATGGVLYQYANEYLVKADINTSQADDLASAVVAVDPQGTPVLLSDVSIITQGAKTPRLGVASVRAQPAVIMTVTKQPAVGTIGLTEQIDAELSDLAPALPKDVKLSTDIFRQASFIDTSISNLQLSLLEGALMVIIILFFFLMNLRTTLISVVALPMSILVALLVLHFMGVSINTMSLGGIAIAIGSLVDDAIVDVENVYRRLRLNHDLPPEQRHGIWRVVYEASTEVRMPIFNSSLIIIVSFLPLFFLSGIEGRMLIPLGEAFIVALIASTIVALTLTPVLCYYLLGAKGAQKTLASEPWLVRWLRGRYSRALQWSLGHSSLMLWGTGALFAVSLGLFFTLGRSFLPSFNEGSFTVNISARPGISLDESDLIGRKAEQLMLTVPEVVTVARKTGRAELDEHSLGVNVSEIEVPYRLKDRPREAVTDELRRKLSLIPGANIEIGQPISHRIDAMLSGTEAQIAIKVFGPDLARLHEIGTAIKGAIHEVPGVVDVNVEQQTLRPILDIRPRRQMLARYGITMPQFANYIETALHGTKVSEVYEDNLPYDLTLKVADDRRDTRQKIQDLMIDSRQGPIPLSYVADVAVGEGPNTINREDVSRRLVVSANVEGRDLRGAVNDIQGLVAEHVTLPEGYYVEYGGQFESEAAASRTLGLATIIALLVILMLLYKEFHSLPQSLVILINMPLAMIGGVLILIITGGELNIPAIIGFISLLGITTRNGMLLISRYNHLQAEGLSLSQRIAQGSADRLNPILMTALTSALALIPLALRGSEPGNEIQSPLAIVILGGLVTSTVLNVFVVPILYRYISRNKQ